MKNISYVGSTLIILAVLTACNAKTEKTAKGVICEASMNTLAIVAQNGDTLSFSTVNADVTAVQGILLGDTAAIVYSGTVDGTKNGMLAADTVVVSPAPRPEKADPTGTWVQPIPGQPGQMQGVRFNADGTAASVNMATLVYKNWKQQGDSLILTGESIGNRQTLSFTDTVKIEKITADSLVLSDRGYTSRYSKGE